MAFENARESRAKSALRDAIRKSLGISKQEAALIERAVDALIEAKVQGWREERKR